MKKISGLCLRKALNYITVKGMEKVYQQNAWSDYFQHSWQQMMAVIYTDLIQINKHNTKIPSGGGEQPVRALNSGRTLTDLEMCDSVSTPFK